MEYSMIVLVINAGSSSIKYQLYKMPEGKVLAKGVLERIGEQFSKLSQTHDSSTYILEEHIENHEEGIKLILRALANKDVGVIEAISEIGAVGHRVVHGGDEFTGSVLISEDVITSIEKFADLAPLHNPANLTGIRAAKHNLLEAIQVACFDTAFHATIPQVAHMYALPYDIYERHRIRKYGFHGISHRYVARRAAALMGRDKYGVNAITCHLGNGCSITAVREGRSVDTSMGLTPLEGLVMGTRCGDFDPAILFYLADKGYDLETLNTMCNKQGGLLGISGRSNDMRNLQELAQNGDVRAKLAIEIFCYRIKKYIGAYTAVLGSVDCLVFTGGIGENAVDVRAAICNDLAQLDIEIDPAKNNSALGKEELISKESGNVKVFVIPTNEEAAIASDTYKLSLTMVKS